MNDKECCDKCFKWGKTYGDYEWPCLAPNCKCHAKPDVEGWTPSKLLRLAQDTCGREPTATDGEFFDALTEYGRGQYERGVATPNYNDEYSAAFEAGRASVVKETIEKIRTLKDLRDPDTNIYKIINAHELVVWLQHLYKLKS